MNDDQKEVEAVEARYKERGTKVRGKMGDRMRIASREVVYTIDIYNWELWGLLCKNIGGIEGVESVTTNRQYLAIAITGEPRLAAIRDDFLNLVRIYQTGWNGRDILYFRWNEGREDTPYEAQASADED